MTEKLYKEIHKFIRWADRNYPDWGEENDNGGWEFGYGSHFDEMYEVAMNIISENWYQFEEKRRVVFGEVEKIGKYLGQF